MNDASRKTIALMINAQREAKKDSKGTPMSINAWANAHKVSPATASNVLTGKWENIADAMWKKLAAEVGFTGSEWNIVPTRDFQRITGWLQIAQVDGISLAMAHDAGSGKSAAMQHFAANNPEVFYIQCDDFWTKKLFLRELYRTLGHNPEEQTTAQLASNIIGRLRTQNKPLVIIDEMDKLNDRTLMYFISLYNKLDGLCGFFISGAPHLAIRIERGAARDKRGYREILSRLGRRFMKLEGVTKKDVTSICAANGVTTADDAQAIWNDVERDKDLRRVKRSVNVFRARHKLSVAS